MTEYNIFREQLSIKYSSYGHALWEPTPPKPNSPIKVGDVGFIRTGRFHRLFNALLSAEDQPDVPEHYEQLIPRLPDHISMSALSSNHYCSDGINVELESNFQASSPDDFERVSFLNLRRRGAVLSLPVDARREDTLSKGDFSAWMVKHIDRWFAFARGLGLGIERMDEIILVTGCDNTRSWTNIAFNGNQNNRQASFGVNVVYGPAISISWQPSPERVQGAVLHRGPSGTNLPEDQCVFIRGFRVARTFWILPKHLKAAAGPSPDVEGYDCEPDTDVVSIPATPKYQDPLYLLRDYVVEKAPDCDMVLVHDDDLVTVDELRHDASPETLEPDVMMDLLRRSSIEIHKVSYDLSPTNSGPNIERSSVKVAMLSVTFQNWKTAGSPQHESGGASTSSLPGSFPVPMVKREASEPETSLQAEDRSNSSFTQQDSDDSALRRVAHATEHFVVLATQGFPDLFPLPKDIILTLNKIRRSSSDVWPSLSKFSHLEPDRLLTSVAVTFCAVSLLGWVFSFTWEVIFKLFFALLLASFPLSVWFEREDRYRRQLDDMYERLEVLQHQVASLQLNPVVPANSGSESRVSMQSQNPPSIPRPMEFTSHPPPASPIRKTPKPRPRAQSAPQPSTPTDDPPMPLFNRQRKPRASNLSAPSDSSSRGTGTPPQTFPSAPTDVRRKPRSSNFVSRVRNTFAPRARSPPRPEPPSPRPPTPQPPSSRPPSPQPSTTSASAKTLSPASPPLPLSFWRG